MTFRKIKLGIIGLSEGNGHPYSWSAIFNGYDHFLMEECGFPVIPRYLEKQRFPMDFIQGAVVSHIWTQSNNLSEKIAKTCYIKNIVSNFQDLIGEVDGILLARDDANNHYNFCKPFLENGLPIYVDKPFALSITEAEKILNLRKYDSQLFTCTALKYAKEFSPENILIDQLGKILYVEGKIAKDWNKYAIHIIEPILNLFPNRGELLSYEKKSDQFTRTLNLKFSNIKTIKISTMGPININHKIIIRGERNNLQLEFKDSFNAFKNALNQFLRSIIDKKSRICKSNLLEIIKIIELGKS